MDIYHQHPFAGRPNPELSLDTLATTHIYVVTMEASDNEEVFTAMNHRVLTPAQQFFHHFWMVHTSMSVGDVVVVGDRIWEVASMGFRDVTSGEPAALPSRRLIGAQQVGFIVNGRTCAEWASAEIRAEIENDPERLSALERARNLWWQEEALYGLSQEFSVSQDNPHRTVLDRIYRCAEIERETMVA